MLDFDSLHNTYTPRLRPFKKFFDKSCSNNCSEYEVNASCSICLFNLKYVLIFCICNFQLYIYELMSLTYIRHGERPAFTQDIKEKYLWEHSERFSENKLDEPLTKLGHKESFLTGINLSNLLNFDNTKYIYCSPLTRCIDTSINIINAIEKMTEIKLKLRIEYSLCERKSLFSLNCISFKGNKIINNNENVIDPSVLIDNNVIDKELMWNNLRNKYKNYIDPTYESLLIDTSINLERPIVALVNYIDAIDKIITTNEHSIIVCHNFNPYIYLYYYLTQERFNPTRLLDLYKKLDGNSLNFVSIFEKTNGRWDITLDPQRII